MSGSSFELPPPPEGSTYYTVDPPNTSSADSGEREPISDVAAPPLIEEALSENQGQESRLSRPFERVKELTQGAAAYAVRRSVHHDLTYQPKTLIRERKDGGLPIIPATLPSRFNRSPRIEGIKGEVLEHIHNGRIGTSGSGPRHDTLLRIAIEPLISGLPHSKRVEAAQKYLGQDAEKNDIESFIYKHEREDQAKKGRWANRIAPSGAGREELIQRELDGAQRDIFSEITGLLLNDSGELITSQVTEADQKWLSALDPHNIKVLREEIVSRWLEQNQNKQQKNNPGIPMNHMRSGNITALEPGIIAAYLGISQEEWAKQMAGKEDHIPQRVVFALGHYLSISDANLTSVCEAVKPFGPTTSVDNILNAEPMPSKMWRHELEETTLATPRLQRGELLVELEYIDNHINKEIKDEVRKIKNGNKLLPRTEFIRLTSEIRERIIRDYLGPEASEQEVQQFTKLLARFKAR